MTHPTRLSHGHGTFLDCVTVAWFPGAPVPSCTTTVVAVFLEISPANTFPLPKLGEKPGAPGYPPAPMISASVLLQTVLCTTCTSVVFALANPASPAYSSRPLNVLPTVLSFTTAMVWLLLATRSGCSCG